MIKHFLQFFTVILLWSFLSCNSQGQQTSTEIQYETKRQKLRKSFREKREVWLVYPENVEGYKDLFDQISESSMFLKVHFIADQEIKETDLSDKILIIMGTLSSNRVFKHFLGKVPLIAEVNKISFDNKEYTEKGDLAQLQFYPNPYNDQLPISFFLANDDQSLLNFINTKYQYDWQSMLWSGWGYEIVKAGKTVLLGNFDPETYDIDRSIQFDFSDDTEFLGSTKHFEFFIHKVNLSENYKEMLMATCEKNLKRILEFTNIPFKSGKIKYHLYGKSEIKGLMTGKTQHAHVDLANNEVHSIIGGAFEDNFIDKENELILETLIGKVPHEFMTQGLAVYFTDKWQKKGWRYWSNRLVSSNNTVRLYDMANNDYFRNGSNLLLPSLAASFVDFLIHQNGKEAFLERFYKKEYTQAELLNYEPEWIEHCKKYKLKGEGLKISETNLPYLKGFNFAHEGYQVYNSYGSKEAEEAILSLEQIGANSIALVPYSFMREAHKPARIPFVKSSGGENDESTISSAFFAKKIGFSTMLKPQIWMGNSWVGNIEMQNKTDWNTFFQNYYNWIIHYAMLAEIHDIEMLSVGVEMAKATVGHETEWKEIFSKIRGIYDGKLTYSANWGDEFEKVNFWDELDFIGLNCYYPLSKSKNADKRSLEKGFANVKKIILQVHKKYNKPIVFTEIGFRSVNNTWINPHEHSGGSFNEESQKMCYEVIMEGIKNESWCSGILWWKWPSYMGYQHRRQNGFTPCGKIACETLQQHFLDSGQ